MKRSGSPLRGVAVGLFAAVVNYEIWALLAGTLSLCGGFDTALIKGEAKVLSPEVTGVKIEINAGGPNAEPAQSPPGMDPAAGQRGRTEYEGTVQHGCLSDGKTCW